MFRHFVRAVMSTLKMKLFHFGNIQNGRKFISIDASGALQRIDEIYFYISMFYLALILIQ